MGLGFVCHAWVVSSVWQTFEDKTFSTFSRIALVATIYCLRLVIGGYHSDIIKSDK